TRQNLPVPETRQVPYNGNRQPRASAGRLVMPFPQRRRGLGRSFRLFLVAIFDEAKPNPNDGVILVGGLEALGGKPGDRCLDRQPRRYSEMGDLDRDVRIAASASALR